MSEPVPKYDFTAEKQQQLTNARQKMLAKSAHRAVDDPAQLARGMRIVRAALARRVITTDELTPLANPADADA